MESPFSQEIGELMASHQQPLLRYAAGLLRNPDLAQDAVQEAFIRYLRYRQQQDAPDNPKAWLYRVTHNLALDMIRKNRRGEAAVETLKQDASEEGGDRPDAPTLRQDDRQEALQLLAKLPEREQQILILKVVQEKSYKEIAEIMNLSVGNVGFILHTTLKKLARMARKDPA